MVGRSRAAVGESCDVNGLRRALENAGWRMTRQRQAVYTFLCSVYSHPTAEDVFEAVRRRLPRISLATVYNALETLARCNLVDKLTGGDGPARYDCHRQPHYHARCQKTGRIRDVDTPFDHELIDKLDPDLAGRLESQGFIVTGYRLEILGYVEA